MQYLTVYTISQYTIAHSIHYLTVYNIWQYTISDSIQYLTVYNISQYTISYSIQYLTLYNISQYTISHSIRSQVNIIKNMSYIIISGWNMSWFLSPDRAFLGPTIIQSGIARSRGQSLLQASPRKIYWKILNYFDMILQTQGYFLYDIARQICQIFVHLIKYAGTFFMSSFACKRQVKICVNFLRYL